MLSVRFGSLGKVFFFSFPWISSGWADEVIKIFFHTKIFSLSSLTKKNQISHPIKSLTLLTRNSQTAMRFNFYTFALLTSTITGVNAHFQLAYPPPRGLFSDDNEV